MYPNNYDMHTKKVFGYSQKILCFIAIMSLKYLTKRNSVKSSYSIGYCAGREDIGTMQGLCFQLKLSHLTLRVPPFAL